MQETPLLPWKSAVQLLRLLSGVWFSLDSEPPETQREAMGALVSAGFIQFRFSIEVADLEPGMRRLHFQVVASGDFEPFLHPALKEVAHPLLPPGRTFKLQSRLSAIRRTTRGLAYLNSGCDPALVALQPPLIRTSDVRWEPSAGTSSESAVAGGASSKLSAEATDPPATLPADEPEFAADFLGLRLDSARRRLHVAGEPVTAELDPVQTAVLQHLLEHGEVWVQSDSIKDVVSELKTKSGHTYESADPNLVARLISKLRNIVVPFGCTIKNDRNGGYRIEKSAPQPPPRKKKERFRKEARK